MSCAGPGGGTQTGIQTAVGFGRRIGKRRCLVVADADLSVANSSPYTAVLDGGGRPAAVSARWRKPGPRPTAQEGQDRPDWMLVDATGLQSK